MQKWPITGKWQEIKFYLKFMKIFVFLTLFCVLKAAGMVYPQNQLISLKLQNATITQALKDISAQSDLLFLFSNDEVGVDHRISLQFENYTIDQAMIKVLANTNLDYKIIENYIVLSPSQTKRSSKGQAINQPEPRIIKGVVTSSSDRQALPGVNVYVRGTTIGTATDIDGKYELFVPDDAQILVFSLVGMKVEEIIIGKRTEINVSLSEQQISLDELVVVGYGTQIKRNLTGSIGKIDVGELNSFTAPSFETVLQGQTAGVQVQQGSGKLGESIMMRIRGASSVSASNQPLYVVDGVPITTENQGDLNNQPTNPLNDINFNDIESIQVLKDASAAAIYGSRASNGVVLITTKKGKAGKTNYMLNYNIGINQPSRLRQWLNREEYLELIDESLGNSVDNNGLIWGWKTPDELKDVYIPGWRTGTDTDWQNEAFQQGILQKVNFSASGGTDKTRFYTGITYDDQDGILIGNNIKKVSGRLNLDHEASDFVSFGLNMNLIQTTLNRIVEDNAFANPIQMVAIPSVQPVIDPETGRYNTNTVYYNSLIDYRDAQNNTQVLRSFANVYGQLNLAKGLSFRSEFGTDFLLQHEKNYFGRETNWGKPGGLSISREVNVYNYNTNNYFSLDKKWKTSHVLNAVAGMSFQNSTSTGTSMEGRGFISDDFKNLSSAAEITSYAGWGYGNSYLSYFARANYIFNEKYLVSLSGRIDGASRFGNDNRYGFFPAASIGWILSEESFLKESKTISFLKARFSLGKTGNSEIGNYAALGLFNGVNYVGITGLSPSQLQNPGLSWEETTQSDLGIDFGLFKDRISGQIDLYYKETTDMLLYRSLPATSGYTEVIMNVGSLENKGIEFSLKSHNTIKTLKWTTEFNIAFNKNKVLNIDGPAISYGVNYVIEGEEIGVFQMVEYAGVHPMTGDALFYRNDGSGLTTKNYNEAKPIVVGSPNPDFVGGLSNNFIYKQFDLNVLMSFVYGNMIYMSGDRYLSSNGESWDNQSHDQLNRWQKPGDITDVPQARFDSRNGSQHSTRYLKDGSYLRLRNVTLGYNIPKLMAQRMQLNNVRMYISGHNLLTFTGYPGFDPEVNSMSAGASTQAYNVAMGVDFFTAPQMRTFICGIEVKF
ncbi:MAG: TonB-dependent receptor plug [Bacteroidetes bacterium]|nr:MAG: TonB-dependent receptor plug [Bacteroidota bacterium]